jgi:manganese/zinc/iron transport system substrate-binding protein
LVKLLVDREVKAVFVESSVSRKNIDALVEGAQSQGHPVKVGDKELFSDAMGALGSYEGTYIGMLDHNITTVTRGLGGQAPEKGFRGSLAP